MNPFVCLRRFETRSLLAASALVVSLSVPAASQLRAAPTAAGASDGERTHTLFMGADIALERDKAYHTVRDVSGESFVITVGNEPSFVPMRGAQVGMKIQQSLKLTANSAVVNNLTGERAYSAARDPNRKFQAMSGAASAGAASLDRSAAAASSAESSLRLAEIYAENPYTPPSVLADATSSAAAAHQGLEASGFSTGSDMNSVGAGAAALQAELALGLYDAIDLNFEVSAEKPLNNPYVIVIARYREPDSKPGTARNWIYAKSLEPIDHRPKKVRILQGGFPAGFELEKYEVHLYNRGEEVATNVAPKRVALTRDEAFEYLMIEHLSRHKGATVPASPGLTELPDDFPARVSTGQLTQTYYVKVARNGTAGAVYQDKACTKPLDDDYLAGVVKGIRFKPALEKGKPVDGVAALRLNQLTM